MIKKILTSKITSAASSQFVVFGLKMIDAHATTLRCLGLFFCAASIAILFYGWHCSAKTELSAAVSATAKTTKPARRNSRSRAPRTI